MIAINVIWRSQDNAASMAMGWMTEDLEFESWYCQEFSLLQSIQSSSGAYSASSPVVSTGYLAGGKVVWPWSWPFISNLDLYINSLVCFHGIAINLLSTRTNLLTFLIWNEEGFLFQYIIRLFSYFIST
jgi:hypothetical protein